MAASGISIGCRPEIRKNCLWDVTVTFDEAILQRSIKQVYYGKPKIVHPDVYYLQVKVRSKLTNKQLSFQKVAVIESNIQEPLEVRNHVTVIKCKFNQRPRVCVDSHSALLGFVCALFWVLFLVLYLFYKTKKTPGSKLCVIIMQLHSHNH